MEQQQQSETGVVNVSGWMVTAEAAEQRGGTVRTIEQWVREGGLTAEIASQQQLGALVASGRLQGIPPHGQVWVLKPADVASYQPRRGGRPKREGS